MDVDVFLIDFTLHVVKYARKKYKNAIIITGLGEYSTVAEPNQRDGRMTLWLTSTNAGTLVFNCENSISSTVLFEWERLCRRYSPYTDDLEALTLLKTFPQYVYEKAFAWVVLLLGQYSAATRHFDGDQGKKFLVRATTNGVENGHRVLRNFKYFEWIGSYPENVDIPEKIHPKEWIISKQNSFKGEFRKWYNAH